MYLKKIIRFLVVMLVVLLNSKNTIAQLPVDTISFPPGFTQQQLSSIVDLEADTAGNIWASFKSIGVLHFDGTNWQNYTTSSTGNMLPTDSVYALHLDKDGAIWMLTRYGITRKDTSGFSFFPKPTSPLIPVAFGIDMTVARGKVFISSTSGVFVYDLNTANWQVVNRSNSLLPSDTVNSLFADHTDNVWVSTPWGFASWSSSGIVPYTMNNYAMPFSSVNSIAVTAFDTIIAGYNTVYKWSGNSFLNLDSIFSRRFYPDNWCDSLSFGFLTTKYVDQYYNRSRLTVGSNNDIYIARNSTYNLMMLVKPGGVVRTAKLPAGENLLNRFSAYKNDSLIYYSQNFYRLGILPADNSFNYNDPPDSLNMIFPSTFEFDIPESFKSNGGKADLAPNMISTRILNRGDLGWDPVSQYPYYNVPRYSSISSIYCSSIWFGGYDQQGNLYSAAQTYRQGSNDFLPGPLDTLGKADSTARVFFDNIWVTRRTDIDEFRYNYAIGNVQNGTFVISPYILDWPAFYNNSLFPQRLAPFVDFNGDGSYNPYDGDYPDIKGEQMSWCVYNDDLFKTETNSPSMFAEIHASAYGYYCPSAQDALSRLIAYTTFYHYDIYNRSDRTYDSCYFGVWAEMDLGNASDDYMGCNVRNHTFYVYNGDSIDDGLLGFDTCTPVQNISFLRGVPAPVGDGIDNDHNGIIDELNEDFGMSNFTYYTDGNPLSTFPNEAEDYYFYLRSRYVNGTPVTFGGRGTGSGPGATNIPTNYMFPDTTDPAFSVPWTMATGGILPTDVRGVGSTGPYVLYPDSMVSFDVAYITGPNDLVQNHDLVRQLRELFRSDGMESYRKFSSPIIGPDSVANAGTIVTYVMPTEAENYIWTVTNGLIISGQGTNTVEVTWGAAGQGTITAEAFDTDAPCERMQTMEVLVGPPLAGDCDSELTVRIYPNPVKSVLQVETEGSCVAFLRILTASGSLVESRAFNGQYDASYLSKGVYILEMSNEEGTPLVRKLFVKN